MTLGKQLDKAVFVLSTGRTATKALASYFDNCYGEVTARHEPKPSRILRVASHMGMAGRTGTSALRGLLLACRYPAIKRLKGGIYIETNWYLNGFLDVLDDVFDNVRVVHITREPGSYIASMMNFSHLNGVKSVLAPRIPYWLLKPEHIDASADKPWRDMSPLEHYAWFWAATNSHLDRGAELFGERYLRLRYEDIFNTDKQGLDQLARWLGLEPVPALAKLAGNKVHASRDRGFSADSGADETIARALQSHCGDLMARYGYKLPRS